MKTFNEALLSGETRIRQFLESVPLGVVIRNPDGTVYYLNQIARQLFGIEAMPEDSWSLVTLTDRLYFPGSDRLYPADEIAYSQALSGKSAVIENVEIRFQEKVIPIEVRATPIYDPQGNIIYAMVVIQDISERQAALRERKQAEKMLAEYYQTLQQEVESRTRELELEIVERKIAEAALQAANLELQKLAIVDSLTQVANRRWFDEYLTQEWRRMTREQQPLSLILCDIDFFKHYNDTYGHQAGDECLYQVAKAIAAAAKRPGDLVARYGGEEFAVILPNTPPQGGVRVAEEIQAIVRQMKLLHPDSQVSQYITLSLGIAGTIPTLDLNANILVTAADRALYRAKKEGRDRLMGEKVE
ncbi:MAG: diguanylate cyclase [Cyanosarcina radialis HA8281-LM2]|jgi:diguanylate cyclase (GGDEF)-like protein|nr:diguanylate cyclase [Cyanosarcina radialis HA8281-LM2]